MNSNSRVPHTAYILQIHKNPDQVNKFIKQIISDEQVDVFVHIDKKKYGEIYQKILKAPNVEILKESIDVKWGDISQIDSTILLMKKVLDSGNNYDFVCFRSGQDMLVKNGFKDYLLNNKNKIFMTAYHVDRKESHAAFVNVKWPLKTKQLYKTSFHPYRVFRRAIMSVYSFGWNLFPNKEKLPENYSLYNGSQWFCIPLDVVKYIIDFLNDNHWYYNAFKESLCPDEFFFQTLIMNSEYKSNVVNHNLMYIKFGKSIKSRNNPITLKMEHIGVIRNSDEYFARKFDENEDNSVIEYFASLVKM